MTKWFVYIVECSDGTLYTGISTDVDKRIAKHNSGKGAKYTRTRTPVVLKDSKEYENRSLASKEEYRIKQLSKQQKQGDPLGTALPKKFTESLLWILLDLTLGFVVAERRPTACKESTRVTFNRVGMSTHEACHVAGSRHPVTSKS